MARLLAPLIVLATLCLGGCVSISEESAKQLDEVGDAELTTVICSTASPAGPPNCPGSNSGEVSTGGEYQVLIAYRLPAQSSPPESIASAEPPLTFSRSASLSTELDRLAPIAPEAGQRWVGYVSQPFAYNATDGQASATVVARVQLLRSADGGPFPAPFRYRTVVGYRHAGEDPNRPVTCDEMLTTSSDDGTTCLTFPTEEEMKTDLSVQTRDLGLLAGPSANAERGGTAVVPFTVAYNGGSASPSWALAATTTVPGGTAVPGMLETAPAESGASVVPVNVTVPATTPPGIYEVALTATHGGGQSRRSTGLLTVTGSGPVDRTPPELAVRMRTAPRLKRARRIGVVADVACAEPCRLTARMYAGRREVGRLSERNFASGRRNLRIRFRRGVLGNQRRLRLRVTVRAADPAGNARSRTVRFSLRR